MTLLTFLYPSVDADRLEMMTLLSFGDDGAVRLGGAPRSGGVSNSWAVAPTPMHPSATGQLNG